MFDLKTKTGRLYQALVVNGESLTESQIAKRFSIKNPRATVSNIRYAGFPIYANSSIAKNGLRVTKYRHGRASRKLIAAGYRAISMGMVNAE